MKRFLILTALALWIWTASADLLVYRTVEKTKFTGGGSADSLNYAADCNTFWMRLRDVSIPSARDRSVCLSPGCSFSSAPHDQPPNPRNYALRVEQSASATANRMAIVARHNVSVL